MYICHDKEKLSEIIIRMREAAEGKAEYPNEEEIPQITMDYYSYYVPLGEFEECHYEELNIEKINDTNSGREDRIYSNYSRVVGSMRYIIRGECEPIIVKKDGERYYIEDGKHRYVAHILLGLDKIPVKICERKKSR